MKSISLRHRFALVSAFTLCTLASIAVAETSTPIVGKDVVFAEKNGQVAVEAEHFFKQEMVDKRAFHLTHAKQTPDLKPDGDPSHVAGATFPDRPYLKCGRLVYGRCAFHLDEPGVRL